MTLSGPYRERLPRTHDVEVKVKKWAIRKPFTRTSIKFDIGLISCFAVNSLIDVLRIVIEHWPWGWYKLGIDLFCLIAWISSLFLHLERREVTETKQITE